MADALAQAIKQIEDLKRRLGRLENLSIPLAASSVRDHPCEARLTLESGVPVSSADQADKTTLYWTPYAGNAVSLYNGSSWVLYSLSEKSLAVGAFTASKPYDIFSYISSGAPAIEGLVWTDATNRATALTTQDGVLVKSGDATRRYIGSIYIDSGQKVQDKLISRHVWNFYNRKYRRLSGFNTTAHNYNGAYRLWNASATSNQYSVVIGVYEDPMELTMAFRQNAGADGSYAQTKIYLDGADTTTDPFYNYNLYSIAGDDSYIGNPGNGYHYFNAYEAGNHASSAFNWVIVKGMFSC